MPKNPERSLAGRLGAAVQQSRYSGEQITEPARRNGPGRLEYWLARQPVDLSEPERIRRATAAKKAYFLKLAHSSLVARARRKAAS